MNRENFERLVKISDVPLDPREIATDDNLALAALDNQMRAERDERDPYAMTSDKLAKKLPGMGAASLQLPDGLAQSYDEREFRIEDEELLREAQRDYQEAHVGIDPSDVTAVVITRGDVPELMEERQAQFERLGMDYIVMISPDVMTRYTTAERHAQTKAVFFQDDDVALTDEMILNLLENYEPGILVANMYDAWIESMGYFDLAMVGLGAVCDVGLWREPFARFLAAYPGHHEHMKWDADFIFGLLAKWRRFDFSDGDMDKVILPEASADNRLWKQPGQHERKYETISLTRKLRTVALTMLVKDEEANLRRALASNKDWWDTLVLLDTGSTDHTLDVAAAFCEAEDKRLIVYTQDFTNFAEMRTTLLNYGRLHGDYMLLMDADEEWANAPERPELWADAYMLHYEGSIDYAQPRLIASRFPWKWSGAVHSYLDSDSSLEALAVNMPLPLIIHHGDERSATNHGERDVEILLNEINNSRDVPRNLFLLGKCYDGLGQYDRAIEIYERRIALDSHDEEDYWCRLRRGVLLGEHCNDFGACVEALWEAYKIRPHRAEALRALAFYCTAVADATPYPEDDITLVLRGSYRVESNA